MRLLPSKRIVNFAAFLICACLIAFALYLEVYEKINPCPLCIIQRVVIIVLGLLFLIAGFFNSNMRARGYYLVVTLIAAFGVVVAGRQVWLQTLPPDQVPSCGAGLRYMLEIMPVTKVIQLIFQGTGECARVTWRFLHLSIADWTLLFFIFFFFLALFQAFRKN